MTAGWFEWARDFVMVSGADAQSYLHSQLSQEVRELQVGQSTWSFVLQPAGKVDALVRVLRSGEVAFVLDTDAGTGEALLARLQRFKIRVKAELAPIDWRCIAVRGSGSSRVTASEGAIVVPCGWPGMDGVDLLGPSPVPPEGIDEIGPMDFDRLRIEAGWPAMGAELTESTIPGETGIVALAVSFTKGCYPGQELVERIDSRGGNVARRLRLLHADGFLVPGAALMVDDKEVGKVTSVAFGAEGGTVGLGYVGRNVEMPGELSSEGEPVHATAVGSA